MQIWEQKTIPEILKTLEMELAKTRAELHCAHADVEKAKNRVTFLLSAVHALKDKKDM